MLLECGGCIDPAACNYDAAATFDDGSCIVGGDEDLTVTILTDNYPGETTWTVTDAAGTVVASGGPYDATATEYVQQVCVDAGCYTFTINDSFGDGICCAYGTGAYTLTSNGNVLASGGEFAATTSETICLGEEFGCTDPTACNYDPNAITDDGSCDTVSCLGCTHENATNYDSTATIEDGSCLYSQDAYDAGIAGVDITVDNQEAYDAGAASVECSPCANSDCPGDFTADGYIGVDDILSMLSLYDTSCAVCGNGIVEGSEQCDDGNDILGDGCDNCMWGGDPQDE